MAWKMLALIIVVGAGWLYLQIPLQAKTTKSVRVRWVIDGDTVVLTDGQRLRYLGINTPEIDHKLQQGQPYAYVAKRLNRRLVDDQKIRLEFERERKDRYGRLLAYAFLLDGTFVNREMLARGYGYVYPSKQPGRYDELLLKTQREAMTAKKGIWKKWRDPGKRAGYSGNRRSKRFHFSDCPNGKKISRKNRRHFDTMWDALFDGYAQAKGCIDGQLGWRIP